MLIINNNKTRFSKFAFENYFQGTYRIIESGKELFHIAKYYRKLESWLHEESFNSFEGAWNRLQEIKQIELKKYEQFLRTIHE